MASYSVAPGEKGAWEKTLVASTVDTVTFAAVGGGPSYYAPPSNVTTVNAGEMGGTVVKLISSGTPKYGVSGAY
jgi:hypothetical protein